MNIYSVRHFLVHLCVDAGRGSGPSSEDDHSPGTRNGNVRDTIQTETDPPGPLAHYDRLDPVLGDHLRPRGTCNDICRTEKSQRKEHIFRRETGGVG